jgi:hypothetical protein
MIVRIVSAFVLAAVSGCVVLYIAWQHNPQCEFHCEGVVNWSVWLPYGLAAFVLVFAVASVALALLVALWRLRTRLQQGGRSRNLAASRPSASSTDE